MASEGCTTTSTKGRESRMVTKNGIPVLAYKKTLVPTAKKPKKLVTPILSERDLYKRQNGKCFYCFTFLFPAPHSKVRYPDGWTRDHLYPSSAKNALCGNMVLACWQCNQNKDDNPPSLKAVEKFKILCAGTPLVPIFGKGAHP